MNRRSRAFGLVVCLLYSGLCDAASNLTFNESGAPASFVLGDTDRLASSSSAGFYLRYFDGMELVETRLTKIERSGNHLQVAHPDGQPSFNLRIDSHDKHVSIHMIKVEGIGSSRRWGLSLRINANANIGHFSLNDMVDCTKRLSPFGVDERVAINWRNLGAQLVDGQLGSVVLYDGTLTGSDLDMVLAEIWSTEDMVRPQGHATWTPSDVLAWVERYANKLNNMSEVMLEATSLEELYRLTDTYAIPYDVKRVYLHTKTWRGEYWPKENSRVHVNTEVFPEGKKDLLAYAKYLEQHSMMLRLHSVSCGIGGSDPDYVVGGIDERLASWGTGTLETDVDDNERRLYFRPSADTKIPLRGSDAGLCLNYNYFKIGEEIVEAGVLRQTDDDVWVLDRCRRGKDGTEAFAHQAGAEMVGLFRSYGQNYVPAYDLNLPNSLMDELAREYADFVNELQLGHLHFDGPEIHRFHPWVERELLDRIYSYVDHPTTSSRVGRRISAHFEQEFSAVRHDNTYRYFPLEIGLRLEYPKRGKFATSLLDSHFHVQDGVLLGGRRVCLTVPQSGLAISEAVMTSHGLSDQVLELFAYWLELAPVFDDADVAYLAESAKRDGGHYASEDVQVLGKNTAGEYIFTPHRVMGRSSGEDAPYHIEQEWGAVPRFQSITAGTTMDLVNPYAKQEPKVLLYVEKESVALENPVLTTNGTGTLMVRGVIQPGEYLHHVGGTTVNVYDSSWQLLRSLPVRASNFLMTTGTNTVTTAAQSGATTAKLYIQYITLGEAYTLQSNKHL